MPRLTKIEFKEKLYRRRYLLPNSVTLGSMFCGFLSIIYASSDRFEKAALAIAVSIILDGLDGRVARKFNATSKFGVEFDSFSDLISFGVAPAILMYNWGFRIQADEFGVLIGFIFALCAASRLARFNLADGAQTYFTGLPTPGAAGVVAACVNFIPHPHFNSAVLAASSALMLSLSYLMVSQYEFVSVKKVTVRSMRLLFRVLIGATIALMWYRFDVGFLVVSMTYLVSTPAARALRSFFPQVEREGGNAGGDQSALG